ncbi:MAG: glycerophosphodiester phosphodiesterase [Myxococcales bacterium]|nr:glycerophosphodiester phosphodiesterase [Myxococcales bacterium]
MRIWAHRGSHGPGAPLENTLAAFEKAVADGAAGIELDVQLSADGVPVVFHDDTLLRLTPDADARRVARLAHKTLAAVELVGGHHIPTLAAVLDAVGGRIEVNIELKVAEAVPTVARLLAGGAPGVLISSFSPAAVAAAADALPKVPRALITDAAADGGATFNRATLPFAALKAAHATHWHPHHGLVVAPLVEAVRHLGLGLNVWTVNDAKRAQALAALGVDAVMTDRPRWLRAQL